MLRSVKYGLYGAVLAGVVGGSVAWSSVDKTVTLVVDGQSTRIQTTASKVNDVLVSRGFHVGPHDIVAPAPDASLHSGSTIVLKRGRLLHLDVNGTDENVWTTAPTVADALAQLGYSTADFTSVSRSRRLPLGATDISLRTPKVVSIVQGGTTQTVTTVDPTVGSLLDDLGVSLTSADRLSVARTAAIEDGQRIVIQHLTRKTLTATAALPYPTSTTRDDTLPQGQTEVVTSGQSGLAQVTYEVVYLDGKPIGKTPIKRVVFTPPTTQVVKVGTQPPAPAVTVTPGSAQAIAQKMLAARGWGADQFSCLVQLWGNESGWRVNASNASGAYGIPQALPGSKMAAYGADWQTSATTQIEWGLAYITSRYGTPCGAWSSWQANGGWY